jgi:hypothetical protein
VRLSVVAVALLVLAGCDSSGSPATPAAQPGTIHVTLTAVGGPYGAANDRVAGTVTLSAAGKPVKTFMVAETGDSSVSIAAGTYDLAVTDTGMACAARTVNVPAGSDVTLNIICQRK